MMRRLGWLFLVLPLATAAPAQAQNPCTDPLQTTVVNYNQATFWVATLADHAATLYGDPNFPLVTGYELRWYAEGAPSPFQTTTLPRASWSLIAGTTDCYQAVKPALPLATNQKYRVVLVAVGNVAAGLPNSPPSPESNPFGVPPAGLAAPGAPRVVVR